jgi:hypothetical protein
MATATAAALSGYAAMRPVPDWIANGRPYTRDEVLARPSPVPSSPGVYAWFYDAIPGGIDAIGTFGNAFGRLLYIGISPKEPPTNGRPPSRSTLRRRLQTHFAGNAEGSTLRRTLGCLLAKESGFLLRRVGSGLRMTFTNPGEQWLDEWMAAHARVVWTETPTPWVVEREVLASGIPLPLNIQDNPCAEHVEVLKRVRGEAMAAARMAEIVADNGGRRTRRSISATHNQGKRRNG